MAPHEKKVGQTDGNFSPFGSNNFAEMTGNSWQIASDIIWHVAGTFGMGHPSVRNFGRNAPRP